MHYNHNHDPKTGRFTNSLFVSGSSKTQTKDSGYYRKKLPKPVRERLKEAMRNGDRIIVGDAPGIDRQVQDYLKKKHYKNVEVYGPGKEVRYAASDKWKTNPVDAPEFEEGSKEWLAKKDVAMTDAATKGLAIVLDEGSTATKNNVVRLKNQGKDVEVYRLNKDRDDTWDHYPNPLEYDKATSELMKERVTRREQIYQEWKDANRHKYNLDGKLRGPNDEQIVKYHNDYDEFLKNNKEYQRLQKEIAEYESYDVGSNSDKKAEYIKRQNEIYKKRKKK